MSLKGRKQKGKNANQKYLNTGNKYYFHELRLSDVKRSFERGFNIFKIRKHG